MTTEISGAEQERLVRAERRLGRLIIALIPVGAVVSGWHWGWAMAVAFGLGGILAYLNYHWIVAVVDGLVGAQRAKVSRRTYAKLFLPIALLAVLFYVIFSHSWLPGVGVLAGLLVLAAATLLELSYEIVLGLRE